MLTVLSQIPHRRLVLLVMIPILGLVPVWMAARLAVAMSAPPPLVETYVLKSALASARKARAPEFAAPELKAAETASEAALLEYYRTVPRTMGFLQYDTVRGQLLEALTKTNLAWSHARRRSQRDRVAAVRLIEESRVVFVAAEASIRSVPIATAVRANLMRARVALKTSVLRCRAGDYKSATREASFAKRMAEDVRHRAQTFLTAYTTGKAAERWATWVRQTIDLSRRTGDYVVLVDKLRRKCHLYRAGKPVKTYEADLGGPLWDKMHAGDRATPEGMYKIVQKRPRGQTIYYKALLINYPNDEDRVQFAHAKRNGWIPRRAGIGGLIEIHGDGGRREDWTLGCVALANRDMDELFRVVEVGTPVTIVGTISRSSAISG